MSRDAESPAARIAGADTIIAAASAENTDKSLFMNIK